MCVRACVHVCVCVCMDARARALVCVYVCVCKRVRAGYLLATKRSTPMHMSTGLAERCNSTDVMLAVKN